MGLENGRVIYVYEANMKLNLRFRLRTVLLIISLQIVSSHTELAEFSDSTHELIGYCAPYHGKVCKSYITSPQVWYSNVGFQEKNHLPLSINLTFLKYSFTGRSRWWLEKWTNHNCSLGWNDHRTNWIMSSCSRSKWLVWLDVMHNCLPGH